jgi:hypothetical protein
MRSRTSSSAAVAILAAAVLGLAVILFVTVGLAEALVLVAVVAALSGMYALRHWARTRLIYDRPSAPAGSAASRRQHERPASSHGRS